MRQQQYEEALQEIDAKLKESLRSGEYVVSILDVLRTIEHVTARPMLDPTYASLRRSERNHNSGQ